MPQYQGIWTLQDAARLQSQQQWATDPSFDYTTLLLQADNAANAAQNNTFLDSSSNAFTITRNGNTTQGTFTPFSATGWSNFFDGSGDNLSVPAGSAFAYGTQAFTVEAWVFPTASAEQIILSQTVAGTNYFVCGIGSSNQPYFISTLSGGGTSIVSPTPVALNQWNHIAWVREGTGSNQFKIYLNGVNVVTSTVSIDLTNTTYVPTIGQYTHSATLNYTGYISNLRVTKGGALYTSNFTPSTIPLTTTVSAGTVSLLTCQSNRFLDASTNAFAVTVGGNPSVQAFAPFAPQFQYTPTVIGGSGYFDGTGDYLTIADNAAFDLSGGSYTIEGWIYPDGNYSTYRTIIAKRVMPAGSSTAWEVYLRTSTGVLGFYNGTTYDSAVTPPARSWSYFAAVYDGTNINLYLNGSRVLQTPVSNTNISASVFIGTYPGFSEDFIGNIANLRITKGAALYSGTTMTVPASLNTTTVSSGTVSLLLNFTNAAITDGTMKNNLETVGNAQVSTSVVKYGSGSMAFDGSGDYLTSNVGTTDLYAFGTGDFTIEMWVYFNGVASIQCVYDSRPASTQGAYVLIYLNSDGTLRYFVSSSDRITSSALSANTWYHVAVSRINGSTRLFINGTQAGSTYTDSTSYLNASGRPWIGINAFSSTQGLNGYIDDLRVTKGIARYTANFTPPQVALPRQ